MTGNVNWREFFDEFGAAGTAHMHHPDHVQSCTIETLYQAFKERMKEESLQDKGIFEMFRED